MAFLSLSAGSFGGDDVVDCKIGRAQPRSGPHFYVQCCEDPDNCTGALSSAASVLKVNISITNSKGEIRTMSIPPSEGLKARQFYGMDNNSKWIKTNKMIKLLPGENAKVIGFKLDSKTPLYNTDPVVNSDPDSLGPVLAAVRTIKTVNELLDLFENCPYGKSEFYQRIALDRYQKASLEEIKALAAEIEKTNHCKEEAQVANMGPSPRIATPLTSPKEERKEDPIATTPKAMGQHSVLLSSQLKNKNRHC